MFYNQKVVFYAGKLQAMSVPDVKAAHVGRKIERIRELKGMKQETLASMLGITQQSVSKMEKSEKVDEEKLKAVAEALGMSVEAIMNFNEDALVNLINNIQDNKFDNHSIAYIHNQYNPIEKIVELYERLLKAEREKNELLEVLLKNKDR